MVRKAPTKRRSAGTKKKPTTTKNLDEDTVIAAVRGRKATGVSGGRGRGSSITRKAAGTSGSRGRKAAGTSRGRGASRGRKAAGSSRGRGTSRGRKATGARSTGTASRSGSKKPISAKPLSKNSSKSIKIVEKPHSLNDFIAVSERTTDNGIFPLMDAFFSCKTVNRKPLCTRTDSQSAKNAQYELKVQGENPIVGTQAALKTINKAVYGDKGSISKRSVSLPVKFPKQTTDEPLRNALKSLSASIKAASAQSPKSSKNFIDSSEPSAEDMMSPNNVSLLFAPKISDEDREAIATEFLNFKDDIYAIEKRISNEIDGLQPNTYATVISAIYKDINKIGSVIIDKMTTTLDRNIDNLDKTQVENINQNLRTITGLIRSITADLNDKLDNKIDELKSDKFEKYKHIMDEFLLFNENVNEIELGLTKMIDNVDSSDSNVISELGTKINKLGSDISNNISSVFGIDFSEFDKERDSHFEQFKEDVAAVLRTVVPSLRDKLDAKVKELREKEKYKIPVPRREPVITNEPTLESKNPRKEIKGPVPKEITHDVQRQVVEHFSNCLMSMMKHEA